MKRISILVSVLSILICFSSCHRTQNAEGLYVLPHNLTAEAFPAHVEFNWNSSQGAEFDLYLKSGKKFEKLSTVSTSPYLDWSLDVSDNSRARTYYMLPHGVNPRSLKADELARVKVDVQVPERSDEALLDLTQRYTTRYFAQFSDAISGMARERSNSTNGNPVITGGTGFGIMALIAGIERGYVSQEEGFRIFDKIIDFLESVERFHGAWAHWYEPDTRTVHHFSKYDDGADLVETAFLVQGLITLRQYAKFIRPDMSVRIERLVRGVEWDWFTKDGSEENLYWHWSKNYGWKMNHRIKGFDETFITYVLAAASKTHPIKAEVYENCYKNSPYYYNGKSYFGVELALGMDYGGPLFFTHYSWLGLNPKGLTDGKVDYFERNRAHALIHYKYAVENPKQHKGFGPDLWGFTSSDDMMVGYTSHHPGTDAENGTVSPTAAISSIVYTPEESLQCLRHLYYDLGETVFGPMGFYDSYNPSLVEGQQVVKSYLAIDQGPIAVMIENYRSSLLWDLFMSAPEIQTGLEALGFTYKK